MYSGCTYTECTSVDLLNTLINGLVQVRVEFVHVCLQTELQPAFTGTLSPEQAQ